MIGYALIVMGSVVLAFIYREYVTQRALRRRVFNDLNFAWDGDYFLPCAPLHGMSAVEIAYHMAEDQNKFLAEDVEPYIREWMDKKGLTQ